MAGMRSAPVQFMIMTFILSLKDAAAELSWLRLADCFHGAGVLESAKRA